MARECLAKGALVVVLAVVLVSILLPNTSIAWMREHWAWFNRPMLLIENLHSGINLIHLALFLALGMASGWALPYWTPRRMLAATAGLSVATECMQLFLPGRHARVSDVLVDVAAVTMGWALVRMTQRVA